MMSQFRRDMQMFDKVVSEDSGNSVGLDKTDEEVKEKNQLTERLTEVAKLYVQNEARIAKLSPLLERAKVALDSKEAKVEKESTANPRM